MKLYALHGPSSHRSAPMGEVCQRIPSSSVGMKEPKTREGCSFKVAVKFSIWTAGQETTWGTEKWPAGLPSTERHLLYNHWWKEMSSLFAGAFRPLLPPTCFTSDWASLVLIPFFGNLSRSHPATAFAQVLGLNHLPLFRIHKMTRKRIPLFSRALMKLLKNWGYMIRLSSMRVTGPQLHQRNLFLCGLLFPKLWHFHLEDELILSWAKSPLFLGRMLGLRPSQDPGAVRPNPIPMWWWVSLP